MIENMMNESVIYPNTNGRKQDVHLIRHGMLLLPLPFAQAAIFGIAIIVQDAILRMRLGKKRCLLCWGHGCQKPICVGVWRSHLGESYESIPTAS